LLQGNKSTRDASPSGVAFRNTNEKYLVGVVADIKLEDVIQILKQIKEDFREVVKK